VEKIMLSFKQMGQGVCRRENGFALVSVIILMLVAGLIVTPLLQFMGTGVKTGIWYDDKTQELNAADAGIEDAYWRVKYDHLSGFSPAYQMYDYSSSYQYAVPELVNSNTVNVTIQNVWIPFDPVNSMNLTPPSQSDAERIISGLPPDISPKVIVTTGVSGNTFKLKLQHYPALAEVMGVNQIGVWLSGGFNYDVTVPSSLESYYTSRQIVPHAGGEAVIWSLAAYPFAGDANAHPVLDPFPGVDPTSPAPLVSEISFSFTGPEGVVPTAVAWIDTDMSLTQGGGIVRYAWSADTRIFRTVSVAGDTKVEAYVAKNDLRELSLAKPGDYYATGNSLMIDSNPDHDSYGIRDTWVRTDTSIPVNSSSASVVSESSVGAGDGVAPDGEVEAAYLYWTSWFLQGLTTQPLSDDCSDFATPPIDWIRGGTGGGSQTRVPIGPGDGDSTGTWNSTPSSPSTSWDKVDDPPPTPNHSDYVTGTTHSGGYKLFAFDKFSIPAGSVIENLTVYFWAQRLSGDNRPSDIRAHIKVNGDYYSGSRNSPTTSWGLYSGSWNTNPATVSAWKVDEINGVATEVELQQFGVYSDDLDPDVRVSMVYAEVNLAGGSRWTIYNGSQFQGQGSATAGITERTLTMGQSVDLSSSPSGSVTLSWDQSESGDLEPGDCLYYAFSADGGSQWDLTNRLAFRDDIQPNSFSVPIPNEYLTSEFKMRLYFTFESPLEYVRLDNIRIERTVAAADTAVYFKIDGHQVYFDSNGDPAEDVASTLPEQQITAGTSEVITSIQGFSYASKRDVTALVRAFAAPGPSGNLPGIAAYTVGGVDGTRGDNDPDTTQMAHAGWSLVIRYTSPTTKGHFIYMYDRFTTSLDYDDVDFDKDGKPGGTITGFIVPEPARNSQGALTEETAARLTMFVGEGDNWPLLSHQYVDFVAFNAPEEYWGGSSPHPQDIPNAYKLWDGIDSPPAVNNTESSPNNVWNGRSTVSSADGIDIDTFKIPWDSNHDGVVSSLDMLSPGDTSAHLDLYNDEGDNYNLIYMIVSIRSVPTIGGALSYLIGR
jgi:hypothetical protein